jgi:DNA invertase Pin-like site-specific DNA recombinase
MEVRNIRTRVKQGLETASGQGFWIGKPPLGYRTKTIGRSAKDRKTLVPDENAVKIKEIFSLASDGLSAGEISREVGIPRTTIIGILENPVYYGYRKLTRRNKTKNTDDLIISSEEKTTWVKHDYPLIVSEDILKSCKAYIKEKVYI